MVSSLCAVVHDSVRKKANVMSIVEDFEEICHDTLNHYTSSEQDRIKNATYNRIILSGQDLDAGQYIMGSAVSSLLRAID